MRSGSISLLFVLTLFGEQTPQLSQEQLGHGYYLARNSQVDPNKPGGPRKAKDGPIDPNKPGGPRRADDVKLLNRATDVFSQIMRTPDQAIPEDLLNKAECVAIVPGVKKRGLGFGGMHSKGVTTCRAAGSSWTAPSFFTVQGRSLGFEQVDMVLLVMNREGVEKLIGDEFTVGVDASAAAGPVGRKSSAQTSSATDPEILTYARAKGLFAGVAFDGVVVKQDKNSNRDFYGKEIDARSILIESVVSVPVEARPLSVALSRLSPRKEK